MEKRKSGKRRGIGSEKKREVERKRKKYSRDRREIGQPHGTKKVVGKEKGVGERKRKVGKGENRAIRKRRKRVEEEK